MTPLKNPICRNHSTIIQTDKQEKSTVILAESEGLGSLRSPASLLRKLSYYRLLLTRLRLAKDCKGSNPVFTFKQKTGHSFCYALFFMAESKGFEPSNRFRRLHDFQSCSFDQLGQLSIDQMTRNIIYDFIQKSKQIFSYYSKFTLSAHTHIKRSPMRLPSEPKTSIFLQSQKHNKHEATTYRSYEQFESFCFVHIKYNFNLYKKYY